MFRLAIVADDLTGSMDTGVQFAKRGLCTVVSLSDRLGASGAPGADVIVLNTNSRPDQPEIAAEKVRATGQYVSEIGVASVYKKIDSTLRGNVGPELDALMQAWQVKSAVLTPAFPAVGRTMLNGDLLVNDVPWEDTQYAEDRGEKTSQVARLIGTRQSTASLDLQEVAAGVEALAETMRGLMKDGVGIMVADAISEEDLLVVASAAVKAGLDRILCGSGGMAEVLPEAMGMTGNGELKPPAIDRSKPVLVIAGTVNRVTIEQVCNASRDENTLSLEVLPAAIGRDPKAQEEKVAQYVREALAGGRNLIISSVPLTIDVGASMVARDAAVADALGPIIASSLNPGDWSGIIMTGGDTAVSVCQALDAGSLQIIGEVEPGVPYGALLEGKLKGQIVVTKAGGFGSPKAISNSIRFMRGED